MPIAATLVGSNQGTNSGASAETVTGATTNGASWVVFAATTGVFGANPITDNKGNTYVQIGTTKTTFGVGGTFWYKENGTGGASHIFTATAATTPGLITLIVIEITGGVPSGLLDKSADGNDDLATPFTSAATAVTTQANEVVIAGTYDNRSSGTLNWGTYTSLADLTNSSFVTASVAKLNITATGTQQSSFTNATVTEAMTWIATFKELTAAGATLMGQASL